MMRPPAVEKGLHFEVIRGERLPAIIKTDYDRVQQCLVNLVGNAVKFTDQGHVHLNVSLQDKDTKSFIRFDVEDTGIGIPADRQQAIFESFTQVDGSTTRKFGGTGLGLAITKRLTELLGGNLSLTSKEGRGSVFTLKIPAGVDTCHEVAPDRQDPAEKKPTEAKKSKFSGRILIAEDIATNRKLLAMLLENMGFAVAIAEDGQQAVDKALVESFDLILMDMQMPNLNGYEATKILRKKGIKVPIIAVTAHAMRGDDKKCIRSGCDDYLSKPIDRNKLLEKICQYLQTQNIVKS
jgi:CheY-like chemotaxis protein